MLQVLCATLHMHLAGAHVTLKSESETMTRAIKICAPARLFDISELIERPLLYFGALFLEIAGLTFFFSANGTWRDTFAI